jgi:hypothetical protein
LASDGNRVILLNNVVISSRVDFSTPSIYYASEVAANTRSGSQFRIPKVILIIMILVIVVAIGTQTVLQSQSSSATMTPLSLSPEHLAWQLQVTGLVHTDLNLTIADLHQMPLTSVEAAIYCLPSPESRQGYFHEGGDWTGVKLRDILDQAGVLPETQKLAFYASDGFTTDLTLDVALGENVLLAFGKNGRPSANTYVWSFLVDGDINGYTVYCGSKR